MTQVLPPAMPHGKLTQVFDDIFFVTGTTRPKFGGEAWQFSRNMTVLRQGRKLTLVNTLRLDADGLEELEQLGDVAHVVRLGAFHGYDDRFYLDRYRAQPWALAGMDTVDGQAPARLMTVDGELPISNCTLFAFETSKMPEGLLLLEPQGGILVSCDSLQNWVEADEFFDGPSAEKMKTLGFIRPANVGPGWRKAASPEAADFARLAKLTFRHLLPAHGRPLLNDAKEQLQQTFADEFDV